MNSRFGFLKLCHSSWKSAWQRLKKKNVFSTMQCHISLYINHILILIIQKLEHPHKTIKNSTVLSERLTTSTALALMLLQRWKACLVAKTERFNILYFHKFCRLCEKFAVHIVTRTPVTSHRLFWFLPFRNCDFQKLLLVFQCLTENKLPWMLLLLF